MKYETLVKVAGDLPLVDSPTLRLLTNVPRSLSVQLSRWVRDGRLIRLRRGAYALPAPWRRSCAPAEHVANLLHSPSYVSLERALSIYGLIPEGVPVVTSVTTGRPITLTTGLGAFVYRHVKVGWFFGYCEMAFGGGSALVATPEKALLDLIYLGSGEWVEERIAALRLQNLHLVDPAVLLDMADARSRPRVRRAAERLRRHVESEREELEDL